MANRNEPDDRLDGWGAIADYMGWTVRTVIRWEKQKGLPVHRLAGGKRQPVYAFRRDIDEWFRKTGGDGRFDKSKADLHATNVVSPGKSQVDPSEMASRADPNTPDTLGRSSARTKRWVILTTAVGVMAFIGIEAQRYFTPTQFLLAEETQITKDGAPKGAIVSSGDNLYFGEWREGRIPLMTVPIEGGPVREVSTPFAQVEPVGSSPDKQSILVLGSNGQEQERELWAIPIKGGAPRRLGNFQCHFASWSPDGKLLAYAYGNSIFLTSDQGASQHLLHTFPSVPKSVQWSMDSRRLIVFVRNMETQHASVWTLHLSPADRFTVTDVVPANIPPEEVGALSPVIDDEDDAFLAGEDRSVTVSVIQRPRQPWTTNLQTRQFARLPEPSGYLAVAPEKQLLFVSNGPGARNELDEYEPVSHDFRPFLPGVSARDVAFSADGARIVFVREIANTLWVSDVDGSNARQLDTEGMVSVELPRWSPDDKSIAFMGKKDGAPFRIYVVPSAGGISQQASHGEDNQGAPTWSPDDKTLVYGRVMCQEQKTCAIQQIDLKSGQQTMVPGSEGLSTARMSPDGRYIAALLEEKHEVHLLDRASGKWHLLATGISGNDLAWAPDSMSVYASNPVGDRPQVDRIALKDGKMIPAVDLTSFSKLAGRVDTWFAITPSNSIIFLHLTGFSEIYSLHYVIK